MCPQPAPAGEPTPARHLSELALAARPPASPSHAAATASPARRVGTVCAQHSRCPATIADAPRPTRTRS
eukprot:5750346-Prymnesium_polylepis.1